MSQPERRGMTAEEVAQTLACGRRGCPCGKRQGMGWVAHCPVPDHGEGRGDLNPSFGVRKARDGGMLLVHCFAGCSQDGLVAALRERGLWPEQKRAQRGGAGHSKLRITQYYVRDATGTLVAVHERRDGRDRAKRFIWRRPDGPTGLGGMPVGALPLYGAEKLGELAAGTRVVVVEGEKAADALTQRGIAAIGTVTGALGTPCAESLRVLLPYQVHLWPDNDEAGRGHITRIAESLMVLGHRGVSIVGWPDAPEKGDAADFTGSDDDLKALLDAARPYEPRPEVDLAALLGDVRAYIRRYVVLSDAQADAVTLWTAHTHAFGAAESTLYLSVTSAEKRSGKTRLLEALESIVARPWFTGRLTAAALYRRIHAERPSLLLDESEAAFKSGEEYAESLRGVLNTGHRRGGATTVCVGQGANITYGVFSTFSPKAIAGIGKLPDTIADRAVSIILKRRCPGESVERFRWRGAQEEAAPLREKLEAWAGASVEALTVARPDIPPDLDDRAADGWEPLLAIADAAAGEWPERARSAALALSVGDGRDDDSFGVRLLKDIRAIFDERTEDRVTSADMVAALVALEESPWGDLRGKPLSPSLLAWRLRPYGIRPKTIRLGDDTAKGYRAEFFLDAWTRYLRTPGEPSQPSQTPDSDTADVTGVTGVTAYTGVQAPPLPAPAGSVPDFGADDGRRLYTYSLAEVLDFPHVSLGEREIAGRTVSVGVPAGRFCWQQAVKFCPDDRLQEVMEHLEEINQREREQTEG